MALFESLAPLVTVLNSPSNRVMYLGNDICLSEIYDPACVKASGRKPSLTATCLAKSLSTWAISLYSKFRCRMLATGYAGTKNALERRERERKGKRRSGEAEGERSRRGRGGGGENEEPGGWGHN
jgi:hypothetical protein